MTADAVRFEPFTIAVPEAEIADLRERLARTRWPDTIGEPWSSGKATSIGARTKRD